MEMIDQSDQLRQSLTETLSLLDILMEKMDWGKMALTGSDIQKLNTVPSNARRVLGAKEPQITITPITERPIESWNADISFE